MVLAGFILMPDMGASKVIYTTSKHPIMTPVKCMTFGLFEVNKTVPMTPAEINSSATNAVQTPASPGMVTAKLTCGIETALPSNCQAIATPTIAPMN